MKISLVEDKIEEDLVSPLIHKSDICRNEDSDEKEEEDRYLNDSSDVLPPINLPPSPTIDSGSSSSIEISSTLDYESYQNKTEYQSLSKFIDEMGSRSRTAGYEDDYLSSPRKGGKEKENLKLPDGMHPLTTERGVKNLYLYSPHQKISFSLSIMQINILRRRNLKLWAKTN